MTRKKELHYFYVNYSKGQQWYEEHFADAGHAIARGEITPDYLYHESALRNMAKDVPDARLFVILRNPIERAISQYFLQEERFGGRPFGDVIAEDTELLDRGLYFKYLSRVFDYFPRARVRVMVYDDMIAHPAAFISDLYEFVGVDTTFRPQSINTTYNRVIYPQLQRMLLKAGMGWVIEGVKRSSLGEWARMRHRLGQKAERGIPDADRARLRAYFAEDNNQLSDELGRDLSEWLTCDGSARTSR